MRESIRQLARICAETLPVIEPIYEFGSIQVPGQEGFADLRPFFRGKEYVGADMRAGVGVDVILNLHEIDLPSESVGTVLIFDTLEHVEFPRKAMVEIRRILKPNGIVVSTSVMNFPIHDCPHDYWRFTPEAFRSLLGSFGSSFVDSVGKSDFPHTIVGIGFRNSMAETDMGPFLKRFKQWKAYWDKPSRSGWREVKPYVRLTLRNAYRKIVGF